MILRNCATWGYRNPEIATKKTFIHEYLPENKIFFENILGVTQWPMYYCFMKKTRARKSQATVPLMLSKVVVPSSASKGQ